jgi:hypothetical protein
MTTPDTPTPSEREELRLQRVASLLRSNAPADAARRQRVVELIASAAVRDAAADEIPTLSTCVIEGLR